MLGHAWGGRLGKGTDDDGSRNGGVGNRGENAELLRVEVGFNEIPRKARLECQEQHDEAQRKRVPGEVPDLRDVPCFQDDLSQPASHGVPTRNRAHHRHSHRDIDRQEHEALDHSGGPEARDDISGKPQRYGRCRQREGRSAGHRKGNAIHPFPLLQTAIDHVRKRFDAGAKADGKRQVLHRAPFMVAKAATAMATKARPVVAHLSARY